MALLTVHYQSLFVDLMKVFEVDACIFQVQLVKNLNMFRKYFAKVLSDHPSDSNICLLQIRSGLSLFISVAILSQLYSSHPV